MNADLVLTNIGQLVTCSSGGKPKRGNEMRNVGIIDDGAVAIADGKFLAVGPRVNIEPEFNAAETVDVGGRAVCPGFIDPHTHIVFAGDRLDEFELKIQGADYLEILKGGGGIVSTVRKTREAPFEELVGEARARLDKMLACGTTTAEIKTGYGLDIENELKMLRVIEELDVTHSVDIVPTFLAAHAIPPEFKGNESGYVDLICEEMLPQAWAWYRASQFGLKGAPFFADVFCERNAFNLEQARRILKAAAALGFRLKAHVDQFTNLGGSRVAISSRAVSIDHLDTISDEEIAELASSDTIGVVIPTENFSAGKTHYADARRMVDAGCAVAISTDYNPGSAPCPSVSMAMAITCRYQKLLPAEVLNAATINAAFAIGVSDRVGSIEPGKTADVVIFGTSDYRMLAYEFGGNQVDKVFKEGKLVVG